MWTDLIYCCAQLHDKADGVFTVMENIEKEHGLSLLHQQS